MKSKLIVAIIAVLVIASQIAPVFAGDPSQWLR
jgi:hypothetical protein